MKGGMNPLGDKGEDSGAGAGEQPRKVTEAAEAANRAGDDLITNINAEIRTSLQSIVPATDLVVRTSLTAEQAELVEIVRLGATDLERLLDEVSPS